jgi:hypothetical protein
MNGNRVETGDEACPDESEFHFSPQNQRLVVRGSSPQTSQAKKRLRGTNHGSYVAMLNPQRRVEKIEMDPGGRATARRPSGIAAGQMRGAHEQPVLGYQVASVIV